MIHYVAGATALGVLWLLARAGGTPFTRPSRALSEEEAIAVLANEGIPAVVVQRDATHYLVRVPSTLGGVTFRYIAFDADIGRGKDRKSEVMNPRLAVMLLRLGKALSDKGVRYIEHAGIYPGDPNDPLTMHNRGFAADLNGFVFTDGSSLSVLHDWSTKQGFFRFVYDVLCAEAECTTLIGGNFLLTPDHASKKLAEDHKNHFHVQIDH